MRRKAVSWFDFLSKEDTRPAIPPFKTDAELDQTAVMEVEESEGTDGHDTIIQKVKRFWSSGSP
jgi:hypothetical protein